MSLTAGTRFGAHEIIAPLGAGGMGEVYRARDTTLDRQVALKILPDALANDPDRLARFTREAKTLAALNHPNIAHIHGLETSGGIRAIVMELVEGPTLEELIGAKGATAGMDIDQALPIAKQIADALEVAHTAGIVHRDLKPANIKVTPDGVVKVLDFGLAKATDPVAASDADIVNSPTITSPVAMTRAGVILGTAAYMAPEQARGKAVDRRADIWAFGCVLFEMLTGRRAFAGETVSDVLAAILKNDPDWTLLPDTTPISVRRVLRRCLERDPKRRLRDIADARLDLDAADEPASVPKSIAARNYVIGAFAAGAVVATLAVGWALRPAPAAPDPARRFGLDLSIVTNVFQRLTLSPDGQRLAFVGRDTDGVNRVYLRSFDGLSTRVIPGTQNGQLPFFSRDGQQIGFFADGQLKRVLLSGGQPQDVAPAAAPEGAAWADDGSIVYVPNGRDGIHRVDVNSGTREQLLESPDAPVLAPWPLPGRRGVLFAIRASSGFDLAVWSAADRTVRRLVSATSGPMWSDTGHVLYQQNQTVFALPFNLDRLEASGAAVPVVEGVMGVPSPRVHYFAAANEGTFVYVPAPGGPDRRWTMVWVDRRGQESALKEFDPVDTPRLSPDGTRVAFRTPAVDCDVWSYDLKRGSTTRLTLKGDNHGVIWSPDGERVMTVNAIEDDLITVPSDGSGSVQGIQHGVSGAVRLGWPTSWSSSAGGALVSQGGDVALVSVPSGKTVSLLNSPFAESQAVFSHDGRRLAYVSDQTGRSEVYVQPYPGPGRRWQVSTNGGGEPLWSHDGRELFFRSGRAMLAVSVDANGGFGVPQALFSGDYTQMPGVAVANFDVSADGKRFLMVRGPGVQNEDNVVVILNWLRTWPQQR